MADGNDDEDHVKIDNEDRDKEIRHIIPLPMNQLLSEQKMALTKV
jgi:hypothetical protein